MKKVIKNGNFTAVLNGSQYKIYTVGAKKVIATININTIKLNSNLVDTESFLKIMNECRFELQ